MIVHGFPDAQGSEGNKMGCQSVEDRNAVDARLIPSLAKLDLMGYEKRNEREQKHRAGMKDSCLVWFSLSLNPLSQALRPHLEHQMGFRVEEEMMLFCHLSLLYTDRHPGPRIEMGTSLPPQPTSSQGSLFAVSLHFSETKDGPLQRGSSEPRGCGVGIKSISDAGAGQVLPAPLPPPPAPRDCSFKTGCNVRLPPPACFPFLLPSHQGCISNSCLFAEICTEIKPIKLSVPLPGLLPCQPMS